MMDDIANINTNPSSGHPKEEIMKNMANINTNPSSGYPKEIPRGGVGVYVGYIVHHFLFRIPRGRVRVYVGYVVHHSLFMIPRERVRNPSSGYPKEEMMDNIANINTNPSSGQYFLTCAINF
jgi:hypothetical protein